MSAPYKLTEGMVDLVIAYIQANIGAALDLVAPSVTTILPSLEQPVEYFVYQKPQGYRTPAIFVIADDLDFKVQENKTNYIGAQSRMNVSVVVEDSDEEVLTRKAWRYQTALHNVLDEARLVSADSKLVNKVIVYHHRFSDLFFDTKGPSNGARFRKEVVLMCNVEHRESF